MKAKVLHPNFLALSIFTPQKPFFVRILFHYKFTLVFTIYTTMYIPVPQDPVAVEIILHLLRGQI